MPRECPPAFRIEPAAAETDSAKRRSVRLPIAIAPARYHVRCCASQEKGRCGGRADLAGLTPRRNHGRPVRTMPWMSPLSLQAWDGVNQCERLLRIVTIGSGQLNSERNPATVADQMTFAAQLGPVGWIRSRLQPPKGEVDQPPLFLWRSRPRPGKGESNIQPTRPSPREDRLAIKCIRPDLTLHALLSDQVRCVRCAAPRS
jgi:hypothetical protein